MFLNFFFDLKNANLPVSLKEYLILMEAMNKRVIDSFKINDFYYLSRSALVKDERYLDKFDKVFGHSFKGLESRAIILYLRDAKSQRDIHATYAALTRLKSSPEGSLLYVLSSNQQYAEYGKSWLGENTYRQMYPLLEIQEDETDISYLMLFGECLEGATEVELHDPYIKSRHQFENLGLFLKSLRVAQPDDTKIKFTLVTSHHKAGDKLDLKQQEQALQAIKEYFFQTPFHLEFTWERRNNVHDRSIKTNHGWHITLGRGLDIYKPPKSTPSGRDNVSDRQTYAFTVNYVKSA